MTCDSSDVVVRVASEADTAAIASLRSLGIGDVEQDSEFERRMAAWLADEGERRTTWLAAVGDLVVSPNAEAFSLYRRHGVLV